MINKFRYHIIPDRIYTLEYEEYSGEVTGEEILNMFRRSIHLDKILEDMASEDHLDVGEL
jgi:hypothetical protein